MRIYQLRMYTLATWDALERYRSVHYLRHLTSFPAFDIGLHGLWTEDSDVPRLFALLSYPAHADPADVAARYLASPELRSDMEGFDTADILEVTATQLTPAPGSPLL
ncbi:NIPSNAP domain-containing protein [Nocardia cyriacigeorgica]|uniref:NIPSNAP domain-containing protein n=1 Tax=Nocardia cyriacigeorgica TaxID=135487 RepID=UPI002453808B|nr:NIPSNAP domain-containing protein [Nocardia cyriacigeorgica]